MPSVKVSIVMPSLNVAKYIRQCIESVLAQTLEDIEIICVDAGSTDGTLEILTEYAEKDSRITVIRSDKKSYGYQMNLGMDAATGEYMGIVETDDYAEPDMFEKLYEAAAADDLDVVKSGFFYYFSKPEEKNIPAPVTSSVFSRKVFCPTTDFESPLEQVEFFNIKPTIWSAIYRLDFLRDRQIRFNETPGASFQDSSFNFKVWALAKRVRMLEDCFLHYRQDNEASSINSPGKVYCVADEYAEMERFLLANPLLHGKLEGIKNRLKYDTYIWNYSRLSEPLQKEFIHYASKEFAADMAAGFCEKEYYPWYKWNTLLWIINKPDEYHKYKQAISAGLPYNDVPAGKEPLRAKIRRNLKKTMDYIHIFGWKVTLRKAFRKIRSVIGL